MPRETRVSAAAPGLPARDQAFIDDFMALTPANKLVLAANLKQHGDEDCVQFAAAIRRHVATEEGGA